MATGDSEKLKGDIAVITGAGRNIGRKTAELFAREGAKVAVVDVDEERASGTVELIKKAGGEAISVITDVTDENQVKQMVESVENEWGPISVLVNNVAISDHDGLFDLSVETFDRIFAVNVRGAFLCTREVARSMKSGGGGRIVNVSSTSAHRSRTDAPAYAASKAAIVNFSRSMARILAPEIRVNTLSPTRTGSPVGEEEERSGKVVDAILVGRWGRPEDQANAALFLVDPENGFITGSELAVDGGSLV